MSLITIPLIGFSSWLIYGNQINIDNIYTNVSDVITNVNTDYFKYLSMDNTPYIKEGFIKDETTVNKGFIGVKMIIDLNHYSTLVSSLVNSQELTFIVELSDTSTQNLDAFSYLDTSLTDPIECYYSINLASYNTKCNNTFTNTKIDKGYRSQFKISSLNDYSTNTKLYFEVKYNLVLEDLSTFESTLYSSLINGTYKLEAYVLEGSGV